MRLLEIHDTTSVTTENQIDMCIVENTNSHVLPSTTNHSPEDDNLSEIGFERKVSLTVIPVTVSSPLLLTIIQTEDGDEAIDRLLFRIIQKPTFTKLRCGSTLHSANHAQNSRMNRRTEVLVKRVRLVCGVKFSHFDQALMQSNFDFSRK